MSLLTICQNTVASLNFGSSPASIAASNDALARQMLALLNQALRRLRTRHTWAGLTRYHVITTADGTESYDLPSDFDRYITETFWDVSNYWPMRGSIDPQTWRTLKNGIVASSVRKRFRLMIDRQNFATPVEGAPVPSNYTRKVFIYPTPSEVGTLASEYISTHAVWNNYTFKEYFTADDDTSILPEKPLEFELKWRLLKAKGLDYAEEMNEAEREIERAIAQDTPAFTVNLGMESAQGTPSFMANIPQTITGV